MLLRDCLWLQERCRPAVRIRRLQHATGHQQSGRGVAIAKHIYRRAAGGSVGERRLRDLYRGTKEHRCDVVRGENSMDFILKVMDFILKVMGFILKVMGFILNMMSLMLNNDGFDTLKWSV